MGTGSGPADWPSVIAEAVATDDVVEVDYGPTPSESETEDQEEVSSEWKFPGRVKLVNSLSGQQLCWPGPAIAANEWTIPETLLVESLLGADVFLVDEQGKRLLTDEAGKTEWRTIAAVFTRESAEIADRRCPLDLCAKKGYVSVMIGDKVIPFQCLRFKERPCAELEGVQTPRTPDPFEFPYWDSEEEGADGAELLMSPATLKMLYDGWSEEGEEEMEDEEGENAGDHTGE